MVVATYLDRIVAAHRATAEADDRSLDQVLEQAADRPPARGFGAALVAHPDLAVIAEVKRRSPSRGDLAVDLDPAELARTYETGGAAALSVLTDADFFAGSPSDLAAARGATGLPVLRKDFTVDPRDVAEARIMGADAVLLIVAALSDAELHRFAKLAADLGLDALVEVHDERDLDRALDAGATLVGVNQRDLTTFAVDHERAAALAERMPADVVTVAESGVRDADDAARLAAAGYDAVLVGESLVTSGDPAASVQALRQAGAARAGTAGP